MLNMLDAQGIVNQLMIGPNTNSESSVNFKHARRTENMGKPTRESSSTLASAYLDYDPYLIPDSSDTQEQSGHTPHDYNTKYAKASPEAPSPAREESTEVEGGELKDIVEETTIDPAELEWLIYNAAILEEKSAKFANENLNTATEELTDIKGHETDCVQNDAHSEDCNILTPLKSSHDGVRRSARITDRSGPVETVERCTLAAMKKGLELQAEAGNKKNGMEDVERNPVILKEEDWDRVAEGAGYIISPRTKESVATFIKGTTRLPA